MENSEDYKKYLRDIIVIIIENVQDLTEKLNQADSEEKEYLNGRLSTYIEVVTTLKKTIREHGIKEDEIGLDRVGV